MGEGRKDLELTSKYSGRKGNSITGAEEGGEFQGERTEGNP